MAKVNNDAVAAGSVTPLTTGWRGSPLSTDNVADGAAEISATRGALSGVIEQEHYTVPSGTGNSTGLGHHVEGSARVYVERDDGSFGDAVTVDESVGRMRYYPGARRLEVSTPDGWSAAGGVYPGLISYSAVIPVPATDGWRVCDGNSGNPITSTQDGGIYSPLIERLTGTPGATQAYIPDLRDQFIRGHDTMAAGTGRTINAQSTATSPLEAFPVQAHMVMDHHHAVDHDHAEFNSGAAEFTAATGLTAAGVLTVRNTSNQEKRGSLDFSAADASTMDININHTHPIDIPLYEGFSTGVVGTDNAATTNTGAETRPDNVALYVVIKL